MTCLRKGAALGIAVLVFAVGCGGGNVTSSGSGSSSPTSPSASGRAAFSEAELKARLPTLSDMPAGYTVDTEAAAAAGGTSTASDPKCQPLTALMNSTDKPAGAVGDADNQYTGSEVGPFIATGLASFPSPAAAQGYLDTFTYAAHVCTRSTDTSSDGTKADVTVAPMSFPTVGDASTAIRVGLTQEGVPFQGDIVLARVGTTLVLVSNGAFATTDVTVAQDVVDRVIAKVRNPLTAASSTTDPSDTASSPVRAMTGFRGRHNTHHHHHHRHARRRHPHFHL